MYIKPISGDHESPRRGAIAHTVPVGAFVSKKRYTRMGVNAVHTHYRWCNSKATLNLKIGITASAVTGCAVHVTVEQKSDTFEDANARRQKSTRKCFLVWGVKYPCRNCGHQPKMDLCNSNEASGAHTIKVQFSSVPEFSEAAHCHPRSEWDNFRHGLIKVARIISKL